MSLASPQSFTTTETLDGRARYALQHHLRSFLPLLIVEMAASGASMRLTVDVTPLTEENTHAGPFRDAAIAAFKARRFALPVQLDDTFEQVWRQIEERYKRNYLTPVQAQ